MHQCSSLCDRYVHYVVIRMKRAHSQQLSWTIWRIISGMSLKRLCNLFAQHAFLCINQRTSRTVKTLRITSMEKPEFTGWKFIITKWWTHWLCGSLHILSSKFSRNTTWTSQPVDNWVENDKTSKRNTNDFTTYDNYCTPRSKYYHKMTLVSNV